MAVLVLSLLAGLVIGRVAGGRLSSLGHLRLRGLWLVALALAIQVALGIESARRTIPPGTLVPALALPALLALLVSELLAGWWIVINLAGRSRTLQGALLCLGGGWLANLVAIGVFGEMPVSARALAEAGLSHVDVSRGHLGKHLLLAAAGGGKDAPLFWQAPRFLRGLRVLGDCIPVRGLGLVMSPGDVLMAIGIAGCIAAAMLLARPADAGTRGVCAGAPAP